MNCSRLLVATISLAAAAQCMAWTAIAGGDVYSGDGLGTFVANAYGSKAEASEQALAGCRSSSYSNCELKGAWNSAAVVLARGASGAWGASARANPQEAVAAALASCTNVAKGCKIMQAFWDPGVRWAAVAFSAKTGYYVHSADSREEAQNEVLARCRQASQGDCSLTLAQSGRLYYAVADSGTRSAYGVAATAVEAQAKALEGCEQSNAGGAACKADNALLNATEQPEPPAMAKIKAQAERNWASFKLKAGAPVTRSPRP